MTTPLPSSPVTYGNSLLHVCLVVHIDVAHTLSVPQYGDLSPGLVQHVLHQSTAASRDDKVYLLLQREKLTDLLPAVHLGVWHMRGMAREGCGIQGVCGGPSTGVGAHYCQHTLLLIHAPVQHKSIGHKHFGNATVLHVQ